MIRIRPLAGAVLMTLMLTPLALADKVDIITPGGNAGLAPPDITAGTGPSDTGPSDTGPRDTGAETMPRQASRSGNSSGGGDYSPAEVDVQPGLQTMHFGGASLTCKVASTHDLVVVNQSLEPLPAGTRIKWQLKKEGKRGFFAIIGELGGGETLVADGVLDGAAGSDEVCIARVI